MKSCRRRVVVLTVVVAALVALLAPAVARADTVTDWNAYAAPILLNPPQDGRVGVFHLAMMHGAMYDAVNAIEGGYEPYLDFESPPTAGASREAAAARAAYRILSWLFPANEPTYLAQYNTSVSGMPPGARDAGAAIGDAASNAMIAARTGDGRPASSTPPWSPPLAGFFVPNPLFAGAWRPLASGNDQAAWLKDVKPFLIEDPAHFASNGPWPLGSPQYAREFDEVKTLGSVGSTVRTADQTNAARYWAANPAATWSRVARQLAAAHGLSVTDAARFYAMVYLTAADTFISVWDDKARWLFWRPMTAIQLADTDGNDATEKDATWTSLIPNPPYPDHSSGLSGFSGAVCATFRDFFGTDKVSWTDTNPLVNPPVGLTRTFTRASDAVDEVVDARVWSGIHFRKADEDGARIGRDVAKWRKHHYFKKAKAH
jgi:hypothetical protein